MATSTKTTLLDLVHAISAVSANDVETVATITYLVNSGKVRLCGAFTGAKVDLTLPTTSGKAIARSSRHATQRSAIPTI